MCPRHRNFIPPLPPGIGGILRLKPAVSHRPGAADVPLLGSPGFVPDVGKTKAPVRLAPGGGVNMM